MNKFISIVITIYIIVCIILFIAVIAAAGGGGSGDGFAILFIPFIPLWPVVIPFGLSWLLKYIRALIDQYRPAPKLVASADSIPEMSEESKALMIAASRAKTLAAVTGTKADADAAKLMEAAAAASREKQVAVVTDAKTAAVAHTVDTTTVK